MVPVDCIEDVHGGGFVVGVLGFGFELLDYSW